MSPERLHAAVVDEVRHSGYGGKKAQALKRGNPKIQGGQEEIDAYLKRRACEKQQDGQK